MAVGGESWVVAGGADGLDYATGPDYVTRSHNDTRSAKLPELQLQLQLLPTAPASTRQNDEDYMHYPRRQVVVVVVVLAHCEGRTVKRRPASNAGPDWP